MDYGIIASGPIVNNTFRIVLRDLGNEWVTHIQYFIPGGEDIFEEGHYFSKDRYLMAVKDFTERTYKVCENAEF